MPAGGAVQLRDIRKPQVIVRCDACGRCGVYSTAKLIEEHGPDAKMPDLKWELTKCKKTAYNDHCRAYFEG